MGTMKLDSLYAAILGSFRVFVESSKLFSLDIIWHCEGRGSEEETRGARRKPLKVGLTNRANINCLRRGSEFKTLNCSGSKQVF